MVHLTNPDNIDSMALENEQESHHLTLQNLQPSLAAIDGVSSFTSNQNYQHSPQNSIPSAGSHNRFGGSYQAFNNTSNSNGQNTSLNTHQSSLFSQSANIQRNGESSSSNSNTFNFSSLSQQPNAE